MDFNNLKSPLYSLIINFTSTAGNPWVLPQPMICIHDSSGQPAYLKAAALPENMVSYGLNPKDDVIQTLLNECHDLRLDEIEAFFNRNKKKSTPLMTLFENITAKDHIQNYVDKKINKIALLLKDNKITTTYQLKRKDHASHFIIDTKPLEVEPYLKFIKTQLGIQYTLKLGVNGETFAPKDKNITLLSHQWGWFLMDGKMAQLKHIKTNKLKPFLEKETLYIPDKTVKTYFEKFILDIMSKVNIEAEGFDVISHNEVSGQSIGFVYDFMRDIWVVDVTFQYGNESFHSSSLANRKSRLAFDQQENLTVYETKRRAEYEDKLLEELYKIGFKKNAQNFLQAGKGQFDSLHRVAEYESQLMTLFDIQKPNIEHREIRLQPVLVDTRFSLKIDWFDLEGVVIVGNEEYPFRRLMNNIKNDDPFFKLNDGTFAIIPKEILHKYKKIAKFSEENAGAFRLNKVHHTLIDDEALPKEIKNREATPSVEKFIPSPLLKATLRPYQVEGVQWLIQHRKNGLGACLADDMGLGKTLQTLAALLDAREHKEVNATGSLPIQLDLFGEIVATGRKSLAALIVVPASLMYNWYYEIKKYCPAMQVINYIGNKRHKAQKTILEFDFILTTYATALLDAEILKPLIFHYIVLDESHSIKNKNSQSFRAINSLQAQHKISLTGTPMENSLSDLWSQMEFINPSLLGSYEFFKKNYQIPIEKEENEAALQELKTLMAPYILRRVKSEVAKDLPELIEIVHYSEMSPEQKKMYEEEKSKARNYIAGLDRNDNSYKIHVFTALMRLRQLAIHPSLVDKDNRIESSKHEDIKSEVKTIIQSGQKVLIFSSFKSYLILLSEWLKIDNYSHGFISGSKTIEERQKAVEAFQNESQSQVLLITLKSGGTGLNLTAADYVFIVEPWWNPFAEMQAIARAHRIGRQHNVIVKRFLTRDSIDEKIAWLQTRKKSMASDVLDVTLTPTLTEEDINALLE